MPAGESILRTCGRADSLWLLDLLTVAAAVMLDPRHPTRGTTARPCRWTVCMARERFGPANLPQINRDGEGILAPLDESHPERPPDAARETCALNQERW